MAADISYVWTAEGWLYLAVVLDLFARRVVGWAVSDRLHKELALEALGKALAIRRPGKGLIHHSDSQRIEASSRASDSHSDGLSGMLAPQGAPCGLTRTQIDWTCLSPDLSTPREHPAVRLRLADACDPRRA